MIYALPTYHCGDVDAPVFATVDINPGQARYYLCLMDEATELKLKYPQLLSIQIFDYLPRWHGYPDSWCEDTPDPICNGVIEDEQSVAFDVMPDLNGAEEFYIEAITAEICGDEILWRGYVKHSSVEVSTMALSQAQIKEAL